MINRFKIGHIIKFNNFSSVYVNNCNLQDKLAEIVNVAYVSDYRNPDNFITKVWLIWDGSCTGIATTEDIEGYIENVFTNSESAEVLYG